MHLWHAVKVQYSQGTGWRVVMLYFSVQMMHDLFSCVDAVSVVVVVVVISIYILVVYVVVGRGISNKNHFYLICGFQVRLCFMVICFFYYLVYQLYHRFAVNMFF